MGVVVVVVVVAAAAAAVVVVVVEVVVCVCGGVLVVCVCGGVCVVAGAARHLEREREKGELQKVGVLVLVDQEVVPLLQRRAHRGIASNSTASRWRSPMSTSPARRSAFS